MSEDRADRYSRAAARADFQAAVAVSVEHRNAYMKLAKGWRDLAEDTRSTGRE